MAQQQEERSLSWAPLPLPSFEESATPAGHNIASVNVLSLGFAATAILLSLFLLMALFERFLRPSSPAGSSAPSSLPLHSHPLSSSSSSPSSSKHHIQAASACDTFVGVSVLMPGRTIPTFIAKPAPLPWRLCEAGSWPISSGSRRDHSNCETSSSSKQPVNEHGP